MSRRSIGSLFVLIIITVSILLAGSAQAGMFDPGADWQTIKSEHFRVHYAKKIEDVAQRAANILEEIYPEVTAKWEWKPWEYTEVILLDSSDGSNGLASTLPYNWMLIYVTPPQPDSALAHYDNWLRMLLIHEFTHICEIDAYGGLWRPVRLLLGKTVAPSGINPVWFKEGISQYDETIFTDGGRGRGSYSEMVVRASILDKDFPKIDEADGLGFTWPGYRTSYVYGIKFVQWLVDTYGEAKFIELDKRIRSSILLAMINHQAKQVYGKSFYALWNEWRASLEEKYAKFGSESFTQFESVVSSTKDEQYSNPTLSPDGKRMVFTVTSPHKKAEIRVKDLESGKVEVIRKGQEGTQFSFSPDGTKLVYSAMGSYKRYYRYYDLWLYDFTAEKKKGKLKRLTTGERAKDPDFSPDGATIIYVAGDKGADRVNIYDVEGKKSSNLIPVSSDFIQYGNPRFSPDGRYIATTVWRPNQGWRLYRYNADGSGEKRLTQGSGLAIEASPTWSRDGKQIVFSTDESGISNIASIPSDGGAVRLVATTSTGLFEPTFVNGSEIYAQRYSSKGMDIVKLNASIPEIATKGGKGKGKILIPKVEKKVKGSGAQDDATPSDGVSTETKQQFKSGNYVAFGKSLFLPRFFVPNFAYVDNSYFVTMMTGGSDVLRWNNWLASASYRSDSKHLGYSARYWYSRYRATVGLTLDDYAVDFGNITFDSDGNLATVNDRRTVRFFEERRGFSGFISYPIKRHGFALSFFREDHMPKTSLSAAEQDALNLGIFAGIRGIYSYGDASRYEASISQESGRTIKLMTSVTNSKLGSNDKNEQIIFSGDWREYISLYRHHVLALRGSGGMVWGDRLIQGTFGMGGALGEGALSGGGSSYYFPLRGLPVSTLSKTRAMLFSGEYRFPLVYPQRGLGTMPFYLKGISGAMFADYGNAWNAHEAGCDDFSTFFDQFFLTTGLELRGDFIVGHGLPIHGRVGWAYIMMNRDRVSYLTDPVTGGTLDKGMLILSVGTAF